ncbi:peptide chain release factor N(5)-glutamine methyltransferase [Pectinatus sottacetonis]|uniref:peptide chain release factor N(5)-glutamine methyltransferase n=1 Tax=Pectinatus sottacetonis TaxID=1002795 RepID=UPI0018C7E14C|nr:peptide chain release factor N(5)-glutamine methyltransferase [Pectinatus sottacetonis]
MGQKNIRPVNNKIWTIGEILKWTQKYFSGKNIESPRLDAEVLLSYVLKKERIYLYVHFDEPLQENELVQFRGLVKKRAARIPVAYITGQKEFMGMTFKVNNNVLVPRPETELLVEAVIERLPQDREAVFADIGTGSGIIALSIAKFRPDMKAYAIDISQAALAVAQENARVLQIQEQITFLQGDLLEPLSKTGIGLLQAIISNPPYIPLADMAGLEPEVRKYEPQSALTDNNDGLDFYRRLLKNSRDFLTSSGFLACEVGIGQAKRIKLMALEKGWGKCEILKDLAEIERVIIIWKQK